MNDDRILDRPLDVADYADLPPLEYEDEDNAAEMKARYEYENELAKQGVKLLSPQFPELFR